MSGIFGGSKQSSQSESKNLAYPWLQNTFGGAAGATGGAASALSALLGIGGDTAGQTAAFNNFKKSTGFDAALRGAQEGVTSNNAAKGLLASGDFATRMAKTGSDLATSTYQDYLKNLLGLGQLGLGAGGLIAQAGQTSSSTQKSQSKPGLGGFLGGALSAIPSDPRLKLDAVKIGENEGLGVYQYRYLWDEPGTVRTGYMADEVEALRPDALGPDLPGGYRTVNYTKLPTIH